MHTSRGITSRCSVILMEPLVAFDTFKLLRHASKVLTSSSAPVKTSNLWYILILSAALPEKSDIWAIFRSVTLPPWLNAFIFALVWIDYSGVVHICFLCIKVLAVCWQLHEWIKNFAAPRVNSGTDGSVYRCRWSPGFAFRPLAVRESHRIQWWRYFVLRNVLTFALGSFLRASAHSSIFSNRRRTIWTSA